MKAWKIAGLSILIIIFIVYMFIMIMPDDTTGEKICSNLGKQITLLNNDGSIYGKQINWFRPVMESYQSTNFTGLELRSFPTKGELIAIIGSEEKNPTYICKSLFMLCIPNSEVCFEASTQIRIDKNSWEDWHDNIQEKVKINPNPSNTIIINQSSIKNGTVKISVDVGGE